MSTLIEQSLEGARALLKLQTVRQERLDDLKEENRKVRSEERAFDCLAYFRTVEAKFDECTVQSKQVEETERQQKMSVENLKQLVEQTQIVARAGKCELKDVADAMFPLLNTLISILGGDAFSIEATNLATVLTQYVVTPISTLLNSNWNALFSSSAQDVVASSDTCVREKLRLDTSRQLSDHVGDDSKVCCVFC